MSSVPRFYVETPLRAGQVTLPPHTSRQITTVLRLRSGDRIVVFDGRGGEWEATVAVVAGGAVTAALVERRDPATEPAARVTLCQALLKADKFEWVLQKCTELGVHAFQPLVTRRTVAGDLSSNKLDRWRRIVIEAAEQSGRTAVPLIAPPVGLDRALANDGDKIICWEDGGLPLSDQLRRPDAGALLLFVGPEGGFERDEVAAAEAAGARVASLGPRILRSETAAVAATSLALLAP